MIAVWFDSVRHSSRPIVANSILISALWLAFYRSNQQVWIQVTVTYIWCTFSGAYYVTLSPRLISNKARNRIKHTSDCMYSPVSSAHGNYSIVMVTDILTRLFVSRTTFLSGSTNDCSFQAFHFPIWLDSCYSIIYTTLHDETKAGFPNLLWNWRKVM